MGAFDKHGIDHLSPSSLNAYARSPWLWSLKYLGKYREPSGPKMIRGTAVENGVTALLKGKDMPFAYRAALNNYELNIAGELSDLIDAQRKLIEPMLRQTWLAYGGKAPPDLVGTQVKIVHWFDGVSVPVEGYIDYNFAKSLDDLKTTEAIPRRGPKRPHVRQVALYSKAVEKPARLVYVSKADFEIYEISEADSKAGYAELRDIALSLEAFLSRVDCAADALHMFCPERDHCYSDDEYRQAQEAHKVLMGAM
jgi:hypothetical protein